MAEKDVKDFENSTKCWICDNVYVDGVVKVRDHCHINGKYRGSSQRDCNIKVNLIHKFPIVLHNLKRYDSLLIMHKLSNFDFTTNVIPNRLEK